MSVSPANSLADVMDGLSYHASPSSDGGLKTCVGCKQALPVADFYNSTTNSDGLRSKCRNCVQEQNRAYRFRSSTATNVENTNMDESSHEEAPEVLGDYLYVMRNPSIPSIVKIGRTICPASRARQLSVSQPFELVVCHCYAGWGHLEKTIHANLKLAQVHGGRGREWFQLEAWQADILINAAIVEFDLHLRPRT